jgi:uncharacterized protein YcfJ
MKKYLATFASLALAGGIITADIQHAEAKKGRNAAFAAGALTGAIVGGVLGNSAARRAEASDGYYVYRNQRYNFGRGPAWDEHVAWCSRKYRSYQPRSNTWVSYSGNVRYCRSPYIR